MIQERLTSELKQALVKKDAFQASVIRTLVAAIRNREIELRGQGKEMSDEDALEVLKREYKKRNESAAIYRTAGREDLASQELKEADYVATFLPPRMDKAKLEGIVAKVVAEQQPVTQKDFGKLMKIVREQTNGEAEGSDISEALKRHLEGK
jgi:uncharacterized protein YqeY